MSDQARNGHIFRATSQKRQSNKPRAIFLHGVFSIDSLLHKRSLLANTKQPGPTFEVEFAVRGGGRRRTAVAEFVHG